VRTPDFGASFEVVLVTLTGCGKSLIWVAERFSAAIRPRSALAAEVTGGPGNAGCTNSRV
jgi:hypothetical protein